MTWYKLIGRNGWQAGSKEPPKEAGSYQAGLFFLFFDLDVLVRSLPASNMEDYIPSGRLLQKVSEVDIVYA